MTAVTRTNRTINRGDLRARIYQAALSAIRSNGFSGTTVEAITRDAGVAKGTFFNFYKSKQDVFLEYYHGLDQEIAQFRASLDPKHPLDALTRYGAMVEKVFTREGSLIFDLLSQIQADPMLRDTDGRSGASDADQFAAFLQESKTLGAVRADVDPNRAAALIIDIWAGAVREWLAAGGKKVSLAKLFAKKLDLVFAGLSPIRRRPRSGEDNES